MDTICLNYLNRSNAETEELILGEGVTISLDSKKSQLNNNIVVTAPSGAGKTMSYAEMRLLMTRGSSLICTVSKRALVDKFSPVYKNRQYANIWDLNFIEPEKSNVSYDPLTYVTSYKDISSLAEAIVLANPKKEASNADPYWDSSATALLISLIGLTFIIKEEDASFSDTLELFDSLSIDPSDGIIETSLDDTFQELHNSDPHNYFYSCWQTFRSCTAPKTAGCIYSTLSATLSSVFTPELRKMMRKPNRLDIKKIANEKTVLFVSVSPVNKSMHCFINIFYSQIIQQLFEYAEALPDKKLPVPLHFLMDDFACGCVIQNFSEDISIFREKGISVSLLLQSESQLVSMYGQDEATTIINNCDRYIYLGGNDLRTCKNMAERLNVSLDDLLYMPVGQEYVLQRGQKPIRTMRYNILANPEYQEINSSYKKAALQKNERKTDSRRAKEDSRACFIRKMEKLRTQLGKRKREVFNDFP